MAKLSEVIPALADALGLPETTVEAYAKVLRKAGLLTSGGRGSAAPDQTPRDCAGLLLSILGGSPLRAVELVNRARLLTANEPYESPDGLAELVFARLGIGFPHSLLDATTAIISSHQSGTAHEVFEVKKSPVGWLKGNNSGFDISLSLEHPRMFGRLNMAVKTHSFGNCVLSTSYCDFGNDSNSSDLKIVYTISETTFDRLGQLLAESRGNINTS